MVRIQGQPREETLERFAALHIDRRIPRSQHIDPEQFLAPLLQFARQRDHMLGDRFVVMDRGSIVYSAWKDAVDEAALKKAMAL